MRYGFRAGVLLALAPGMTIWAADAPIPSPPVPISAAVQAQQPVADARSVSAGACVDAAGPAGVICRAQAPVPADQVCPPPGPVASGPPCTCAPVASAQDCATPSYWIDSALLLWWEKNGPQPLGDSANYGLFTGLRLDAGGWIDQAAMLGIDGVFFFVGRNSVSLGGVQGMLALHDSVVTNAADAYLDSQLWGFEFNGLYNLYRDPIFHADLLGGFRYLGLEENLKAYAAGIVDVAGEIESGVDNARVLAQNNFYGGQFGARAGWNFDNWFADITGKVAMGFTNEGLTAQETAIGVDGTLASFQRRRSTADFAVLSELYFRLGYSFTPDIRAYIAYDFLYLSSVARPGNQDLASLYGLSPSVKTTDFWAQGVNVGIEFRF